MTSIRFDDIEALRAMISDEFGEWGPRVEVTQAVIDRFADLTDDHQWIHVDTERAAAGPFGATIAHGFLILALMPSYRPPLQFEITGERSRVNYGCESFRFLAPVRSGSVLHARTRLADIREHP
ncbi:MAG: MaoC family dehydratase, partial [Ilumatobacteraceae bacterium]